MLPYTEIAVLDRNSAILGVETETLMENAGRGLATRLLKREEPYLILAGKGNNGGDGLVAARYLASAGKHVDIVLVLGPPTTELSRTNLIRVPSEVNIYKGVDEIGSLLKDASKESLFSFASKSVLYFGLSNL